MSRCLIIRPSFIIIKHGPCSALHRKPICLWRLPLRNGYQCNCEILKHLQVSILNPFLGIVWKKIRLFCSNLVASLRRALLVIVLKETSYLDKLQGGFHRVWLATYCMYSNVLYSNISHDFIKFLLPTKISLLASVWKVLQSLLQLISSIANQISVCLYGEKTSRQSEDLG